MDWQDPIDPAAFLHTWIMYFLGWQKACRHMGEWKLHKVAREAIAELQRLHSEMYRGWGLWKTL